MTTLATRVAEDDKENAGLSGKAAIKGGFTASRRVLSNRENFTPVRNAPLSQAMSATSAGKSVPQTPVARQDQVFPKSITTLPCNFIYLGVLQTMIFPESFNYAETKCTTFCTAAEQLGSASAAVSTEVCTRIC